MCGFCSVLSIAEVLELIQIMKSYYRIMLGRKSIYADKVYEGTFIGVVELKKGIISDMVVGQLHRI